MARLRFEHALAQGVRAQLACFDEMFPPERAAVHRMMARYGRETMWNLLQTKLADNAAKAPDGLEQAQKPWREALLLYNELLAENACCSLAELRIGGGELLAIGFSGRAVGRAKQRLLDEVASERLANEHGALVRRAERLYRSGWRGETDGREEETMANIMDYLDWRGDLPLTVSPFNEVDGLILAELSFINFEGIVPPPELGRGVPLRDAAGTYFARHNGQEIDMGVLVPGRIPDLMCRMAHSVRFGGMLLNGYCELMDDAREQQFAALTVELGDSSIYLSYRGTDDTIVGWKEDLNMGYLEVIPSQTRALEYLGRMTRQYPDARLRIGGHSKGRQPFGLCRGKGPGRRAGPHRSGLQQRRPRLCQAARRHAGAHARGRPHPDGRAAVERGRAASGA